MRTAITVHGVRLAGRGYWVTGANDDVVPQAVDDANGMSLANDAFARLYVRNDGTSTVVAIASVADPMTGRVGDLEITIPADALLVAGPFRAGLFGDEADEIAVDFSRGGATIYAVSERSVSYPGSHRVYAGEFESYVRAGGGAANDYIGDFG